MKKINIYILEKLKLNKDIAIADSVNQDALENVEQLMEDFISDLFPELENKYSVKPVKAGHQWLINVWFRKLSFINWPQLKDEFCKFTLKYVKKWELMHLKGYRIPPVQKTGYLITFIVKDE